MEQQKELDTTSHPAPHEAQEESPLTKEVIEEMGVSDTAYQEVCAILGRIPTIDELSTLLAMWDASGRMQGLYTWLKGQPHSVQSHDYLLDEHDKHYYDIREPRVKDCVEITRNMPFSHCGQAPAVLSAAQQKTFRPMRPLTQHGDALYMVGNISTTLAHSEYAGRYLHLVEEPMTMDNEDDTIDYLLMILSVLQDKNVISAYGEVGQGGIFGSLVAAAMPQRLGFDILSYREARLDAFLFGEERGRCLAALPQSQEDFFLTKMDEARINCCMLGKVTKGRLLVDDMDFGSIGDFAAQVAT